MNSWISFRNLYSRKEGENRNHGDDITSVEIKSTLVWARESYRDWDGRAAAGSCLALHPYMAEMETGKS